MVDDRGQAFTLEGFVAALLVVASVAFVLQATAISPLSASASSQHVETQQAAMAAGILDAAVANGSLSPAVRYWNDSAGTFHGAERTVTYPHCRMPLAFGDLLTRAVFDQGMACDVTVTYVTENGGIETRRMVTDGTPSDNAVRAVRTVTLYDDDVLLDATGGETNVTLANATTFYAPDASPDSPVYNVVRVEVVVWRA